MLFNPTQPADKICSVFGSSSVNEAPRSPCRGGRALPGARGGRGGRITVLARIPEPELQERTRHLLPIPLLCPSVPVKTIPWGIG